MPCHDYILFIKSDKSQKWSAQNEAIFEFLGMDFQFFFQKFFFILINFLGDSDHFYTYKRSKSRFLAVLWPF